MRTKAKPESVALVYLSRGKSEGFLSASAFFDNYRLFPPGCSHDLIVAAKGWSDVAGWDAVVDMGKSQNAEIIELQDDGFDWGAYMHLAEQLPHSLLCFLNTYSRPTTEGWLSAMVTHLTSDKVGAVGATGSWGTTLPRPFLIKPVWDWRLPLYPLRVFRNGVRNIRDRKDIPGFPNPHLRSNAFIIRREEFREFIRGNPTPKNKRECHKLEHGKNSLTKYLESKGLIALVVGRDGVGYSQDGWIHSKTYIFPGQPNLLVKDNQTDLYQNASPSYQRFLEIQAWGQSFDQIG